MLFCNSILQLQLDAPITPKKINDIELCDIVEGNKINLTKIILLYLMADSKLYAFSYYSSEKMLPTTVIHFQLIIQPQA
jgi:hypothetical protein